MASTAPEKEKEWEKELQMLQEELSSQEELRERETDYRKTVEEEKRRTEESLWKIQGSFDGLKKERENLLQEKDKLRRMAET